MTDIVCIYSTIEDLLYMSESKSLINTSFGVDEDECKFVKFIFASNTVAQKYRFVKITAIFHI
jgi:hypothetical protein